MIITPLRAEETSGHAAEMYAADLAEDGFVFAHTQAMALNPEAHQAFENLVHALVPSLGLRNYELVTLAAARALRSRHCLLAHGRKVRRAGILDENGLVHVAEGVGDADLTEAEVAMMAFAARLSTDADRMADADSAALRAHGFSDRQIVDIALAAAARNYFSRVLQSLAVPVDDVPGLSARARAALLAAAD